MYQFVRSVSLESSIFLAIILATATLGGCDELSDGLTTIVAGGGASAGDPSGGQSDDPAPPAVSADPSDLVAAPPPSVTLQAYPASGTAPLKVTFDASASVAAGTQVAKYTWQFGDGGRLDEPIVESASGKSTRLVAHTYQEPGDYTADLTVVDSSGGKSRKRVPIHVNAPPVADFSVAPPATMAPTTIGFDATASSDPDGRIVNYSWEISDQAGLRYSAKGSDKARISYAFTRGARAARPRRLQSAMRVPPRSNIQSEQNMARDRKTGLQSVR